MVAEYVAMGLALRIVSFYRFRVGIVVYDSDEILNLVKKGNFHCDRNQDQKEMWHEWLLLQAVIRQLDLCLCGNLEIRFRHKKYTQYAGDHEWPPQAACKESFAERAIVLDNFFFSELENPSWEAVRVSRANENQVRIQWTQVGIDWVPRLRPGVAPSG